MNLPRLMWGLSLNTRWILAIVAIVGGFPSVTLAQFQVEAIPGRTYGVARISIPLAEEDQQVALLDAARIESAPGQILYPAFTSGTVGRLLDEITGGAGVAPARSVTVHFLFRGSEPFDVQVETARTHRVRVTPRPGRALQYNRLLRSWWREYNAVARRQVDQGDYPPLVETYLTTMLGERLNLETPLLQRRPQETPSEFQQTANLLLGLEAYRLQVLRDTMTGQASFDAPLEYDLPASAEWIDREWIEPLNDIDIEPIAYHVPEECLYLRFGSWENQTWLNQLGKKYGGDISQMVSLRGHAAGAMDRMLKQIAMEQTAITEMLGGQFISDVAVIGRDTFLDEGSAMGIVLEAKSGLLQGAMNQQRGLLQRREREQGAVLETVEIAGREVSFLSTPDNRIRSFYAVDGNYHIASNSREIVRRFFEAGEGNHALAGAEDFRNARRLMPISREDTIFVFISTRFFEGLLSPHYQVELSRRTQSLADIELVQLAQFAARGEGSAAETIDELIAGGWLPAGFGRRPDGSGPIVAGDTVIDSKRGTRGTFLPIPDAEIEKVTAAEFELARTQQAYYETQWRQMDPLIVAMKRTPVDDNFERLEVDALISPLAEEKYEFLLSVLGPPLTHRITNSPNDMITVQASVKGGLLLPFVPPHTLFASVEDKSPLLTDLNPVGFFRALQILRTTPGYLGAFPKPGFLDLIPFGLGAEPDAEGFTRSLLGLWRWQGGGMSVLSFDRNQLLRVREALVPVEADDPAQVRVTVGDVSHSHLSDWANQLTYSRARQTSLGNTRMLHALTQQLRIPPAEAKDVAESLLNTQLICSLGGEYQLTQVGDGVELWLSDALPDPTSTRMPADYEAMVLQWFRGLDASLYRTAGQIAAHVTLVMEHPDE